jgi:hypothetical protein
MEPNPRVPSRLGCGGLLLMAMGMVMIPEIGVAFDPGMRTAGLVMQDEIYRTGEIWWLVGPLGALSVIAVFRLTYGHRDRLAPAVAACWVLIAAGYAVMTQQYSFLVWTTLILVLIASGTLRARREMDAGG